MRKTHLPLAGLVLLAACGDITVPDYQNPPLDDLLTNPTVNTVKQAAVGVLQGSRQDSDTYVRWAGIVGREGYYLDPNESRYVRQLFAGAPLGTNFTGSSYWTTPYRNIRTANLLIQAVDQVALSDAEKAAIKGFAKTIQAVDFIQVNNTRELIPVQVNTPLTDITTPPPIVANRAESWAFISSLLDEGLTQLNAAGNIALPFPTPSGLNQFGFNTTGKFAQFNRALKARVEVIRATEFGQANAANYTAALTALSQSFISTAFTISDPLGDRTPLHTGVYQTYSGGSGDVPNTLYDPSGKTVADSALVSLAQLRPGGTKDARLVYKTEPGPFSLVSGLGSNLRFTIYNTRPFYGSGGQSSPIPMIRNEELILLRAEARWFTGDKPGAMADLNFIRQNSGGLAPIAQPATDAAFREALLYERTYSLLFEGGHRWVDYRRFGKLADLKVRATIRTGGAASNVATWLPLPSNETLPR
ncbi:MAG TPA: RagB/SusD family nutrient uptake outer membrane protein [Longimicrobium sp.]|jgi:hypothetical protein